MKFNFEDNSSFELVLCDDGSMEITLQAKHMTDNFRITSSSVRLSPDNVNELLKWFGEINVSSN